MTDPDDCLWELLLNNEDVEVLRGALVTVSVLSGFSEHEVHVASEIGSRLPITRRKKNEQSK